MISMVDDGGRFGAPTRSSIGGANYHRSMWRVGEVQARLNRGPVTMGTLYIHPGFPHNLEGRDVAVWRIIGPTEWTIEGVEVEEREAILMALGGPSFAEVTFRTPFRSRWIRPKFGNNGDIWQPDDTSLRGEALIRASKTVPERFDAWGRTLANHLTVVRGWGE